MCKQQAGARVYDMYILHSLGKYRLQTPQTKTFVTSISDGGSSRMVCNV